MTDDLAELEKSPPVSLGDDGISDTISVGQAAVLLTARLGRRVPVRRLEGMLYRMQLDGELDGHEARPWELSAADVDRLAWRLNRYEAGYWQRHGRAGDYDAYVEGYSGSWWLVRLPWAGSNRVKAVVERRVPEQIELAEWPTGERVGTLVRGEDRHGLPAYARVRSEGSGQRSG